MPIQSKSQQRLMQAAAHTRGGFGGVSQSVGKEFVAAGSVKKDLPERKSLPLAKAGDEPESGADRRYRKKVPR